MSLIDFMQHFGEKFSVFRDDQFIITVDGMRNSEDDKTRFIDFFPKTDVQSGDWVKALATNEDFYIEDVTASMGFKPGEVFALKAYYLTKTEYKNQKK